MGTSLTKIIAIAAGICAIFAGLFAWYGQYFPGYAYGFGLIEQLFPTLYFSLIPYFQPNSTLLVVFYIILIASGGLMILAGIMLKKSLSLIGMIVVIVGCIGALMFSILITIDMGIPLFYFPAPGVYYGLGPGFFFGIAALILAVFQLLAIRKGAVTGA